MIYETSWTDVERKNNRMLRESKGNMYSWVTHTFNTIKGECPHGCTYCYMKRRGKQKPIRFDEKELKTDLGVNNIIFVGSSCDIFANDIPNEWIERTLEHCYKSCHRNGFLLQTKNPERMLRFRNEFWDFIRVCTTIETNRVYPEIMKHCPDPWRRVNFFKQFKFNRYVTIEPIMDFDIDEMIEMIKRCNPVQVNIGADSGNNHLPEPSKEKILELIDELKKFTVIDEKRNLKRLLC